MVFALLSLAVFISVLGVANTISLSIYERTREVAILRAIGAARGQIRSMVHQEDVITSLVGGGIGAALGAVFMAGSSAGTLVAGFLAAFLAAFLPARRAAQVPVLEAAADV